MLKRKKNLFIKRISLFLVMIFISTLFLGIGYAQISGIQLNISGLGSSVAENGILIKDVVYLSNNNANPGSSSIEEFYKNLLTSKIVLGNSTPSSITYRVTMYNNTDNIATYNDALFSLGIGYDNTDIEFVISGINHGDTINPKTEKSFTITFKYNDTLSTVTNNTLNSVINFDFSVDTKVARIGSTLYDTLQQAFNACPASTETTVELLSDTSEILTVANNKNIILNLNNHTISNDGNTTVITNNGTLVIRNGTISSDAATNGAINNNQSGNITVDGLTVLMTGGRQALYNNKGIATITGTSYLSSEATARAAVQNVSGGTMNILGGTIISTGTYGVNNAGTLTVGVKEGTVDYNSPIIQGADYGINSTTNYNFYDGKVKSKRNPFNDISKIADKETGYGILYNTEVIGSDTYNVGYLGISKEVTFNGNNGTVSEPIRYVEVGQAIGILPTATRTGYIFAGWYTLANGGEQIDENTIITDDVTYYAHWIKITDVAQIGSTKYDSLQAAINAVPTNGTPTTIELLKDTQESLTIHAGKNIIFDFNGRVISNSGSKPIIENHGDISISNGTFNSSADQGMINAVEGSVHISGGSFTITSNRQILYITGGTVEISGSTYMTSKASGVTTDNSTPRATINNLSGTLIITGGTIIGEVQYAVYNESNMTIGVKDGSVNSSTPVIRGETYGLGSIGTLNFYDGIIEGITDAITGTVSDFETSIANGTEVIGGKTYKTSYNS